MSSSPVPPEKLDADLVTLHIRCGDDIRESLMLAGFDGEFLAFVDPVCQGPVIAGDTYLEHRSQFIADHYGGTAQDAKARLTAQYRSVQAAGHKFERVVLWFEHDSFDQLILCRLLSLFATSAMPERLELICIDRFAGVKNFHGLGQLAPHQIASLWRSRTQITNEHLHQAAGAWAALCAAAPTNLAELASRRREPLVFLARALRRHLQELPWVANGLAMTERLILESLDAGEKTAGKLFADVQHHREPLPFLGDIMFWSFLRQLRDAGVAAIRLTDDRTDGIHEAICTLTTAGAELLAGNLDWMTCRPKERWVGGVRIVAGLALWRWDDEQKAPVQV